MAETLAKEGTKATPSATSASPSEGLSGWISVVVISPLHSRSATASTSCSGIGFPLVGSPEM
jgi:hypothetical protein